MNCIKIKNPNIPGNKKPKTKRQIDVSRIAGRKTMFLNNPMHHPNSVKKMAESYKKWFEKNKDNLPVGLKFALFQKGNKFHTLRKSNGMTEEQKLRDSFKKTGKKGSPKAKEVLIRYLLKNGAPMQNTEIAKKITESRKKYYAEKKRLRIENAKFKKGRRAHNKLSFNPDEISKMIKDFYNGKSLGKIAKEIGHDRTAITNLLKQNGLIVNYKERNILNGKNCKTKFKPGNNIWTLRKQKEVKNEEINNSNCVVPIVN